MSEGSVFAWTRLFAVNLQSPYSVLALLVGVALPLVSLVGNLLPARVRAKPTQLLLLNAPLSRVWSALFAPNAVPLLSLYPETQRSFDFSATLDDDGDVESQRWTVELAKSVVNVRVSDIHVADAFADASWVFTDAKFPTAVMLRLKLDAADDGRSTSVRIEEECTVLSSGAWQVPFLRIAVNLNPSFLAPHIAQQLVSQFDTGAARRHQRSA
jgi:hypothetical protein